MGRRSGDVDDSVLPLVVFGRERNATQTNKPTTSLKVWPGRIKKRPGKWCPAARWLLRCCGIVSLSSETMIRWDSSAHSSNSGSAVPSGGACKSPTRSMSIGQSLLALCRRIARHNGPRRCSSSKYATAMTSAPIRGVSATETGVGVQPSPARSRESHPRGSGTSRHTHQLRLGSPGKTR